MADWKLFLQQAGFVLARFFLVILVLALIAAAAAAGGAWSFFRYFPPVQESVQDTEVQERHGLTF